MNLDEIMSADTAKLAFQRWRSLLLIVGCSLILGLIAYAILPRQYYITADVIGTRYESDITPNNQSTGFSAAALLGANPNDLPNVNDFKLYTQLLTSPELGAAIVDDPIMHRIFKELWDKDHWQQPDTLSEHVSSFFARLAGHPEWSPPDGFTVARYLTKHLAIVANKDAKLITINTWSRDPELGKALIDLVCTQADKMVKQMAQLRFAAKVKFLEKAMSEANVDETRKALGQALAKAETDDIYSQSDLPFAAEYLAPPAGPTRPQFPQLGITLWISAGLGLLVFLFDLISFKRSGVSLFQLTAVSIAGASRRRDRATPVTPRGAVP